MSDTLSIDVKAGMNWVWQSPAGLAAVADHARLEFARALGPGDGAGEVDVLWHDARTLASSAVDDLDLTDLTRTLFGSGVSVGLASVKALLIVNTAAEPGEDVAVGGAGAANDAWAGPLDDDQDAKLLVPAGGALLLVHPGDGWPVTPGTSDVLRLASRGADDITCQVVLAGIAS